MFGLDLDTVRNIKQVFAKIPDIDKVILYGSRAKGNYRNGSDIDITLLGENLTLNNSVYPLMDELEELYLPYMFDISIFSHIDNEDLVEHINRAGKVFYQREKGLPIGWEMRKLGDICEVIAGQSPEGKYYNSEGNGLPFYQGKKEFSQKFIGEPTKWTTKVTKEAKANDILMSVRAPVGPINFSTQKICIGRGLAAIRVKELIDKEFLFSFLLKHENEIVGNTGAVFNSINKKQIENIEIPLPPLPEQKRIVVILDQAFTAINKAKTNAEQNLKNAREVFQSALQTEFANGKLKIENGEWEEKTLGEVCGVKGGKRLPKGKKLQEEKTNFPYIRIADFDHAGSVNLTTIKYLTVDVQKEISRYTISKNDVFLSIAGTIGISGIIPDQLDGANLTENACKLVFDRSILNKRFLYFYTNSLEFKKQVGLFTKTTAQPKLALTRIKNIIINFPKSLGKQKNIVKKLDALSTETKKLETIYQQKTTDLDELRKSILQKAFNGEL